MQLFIAKLVELYRDDNKERAAEHKLNRLRQTDTVSHYLSQFEQLAPRVQWGDFGLKNRFYEGLKDVVKDDIARGTRPTNLYKLQTRALEIGVRQHERQLERQGYRHHYQDRRPPDLIEINTLQRKHKSQRHLKGNTNKPEGKCYNYKIKEHYACKCRKPKRDNH